MASESATLSKGSSDTFRNNGELSKAQILMQKHQADAAHKATIEEVQDEADFQHPEAPHSSSVIESKDEPDVPTWTQPMSAKSAGKQKAEDQPTKSAKLDTQSHELFPGLGGAPSARAPAIVPKWGSTPPTNGHNGSTNGSSTATPGAATPIASSVQSTLRSAPTNISIPGRHQERVGLTPEELLPRNQLKKPVVEVIKDVNRRSKATVTMSNPSQGGVVYFNAVGPQDACRAALLEVVSQIGSKQSIKVPIPRSAIGNIIGKGGATIKGLQTKTGARINMPKNDGQQDDDDEGTVDVVVEGNAVAAATARQEILRLAGEQGAAPVTHKLRGLPAEFYPFLAGPNNERVKSMEEANNIRVQIPTHHTWTTQPPPQVTTQGLPPTFQASHPDNHITLAGDRLAVLAAKAELERQARELSRQLTIEQLSINSGRHQFIVGDRGIPVQEFLAETGCAVILPSDPDNDMITIIGPIDQVPGGVERAMDLASSMQSSNLDISRQHRNAPGGASAHARNVTRYLQRRNEIERLEKLYNTHIVTPIPAEGHAPWELYSRDAKNTIRAQSEINSIVNGHPPSRMTNVPDIDPFFFQHLRNEVSPKVQQTYGVHVVVPDEKDTGSSILLVFEGPTGAEADYQVPRTQPSAAEVQAFQRGLEDARKHILELISGQEQIVTKSIDVPQKFHAKLRKFIKEAQQGRAAAQIPIRVTALGTTVTLRGTASSVEDLAAKVDAFIVQETEDEKERGFTLSFDFPQKHANQLIGKGGSNITALREKFDIEIQVKDGVVTLTGPQKKAEAAKSHILSQGKQWADESTHILKIDPKFHRELIGAQGNQINKLQTRYKVQIHFPRGARPAKDDQSGAENGSDHGAKPSRKPQAEDEVTVRGPSKGADEARDEILSLLQYLKDNSHSATVTVQQSQIPSLIGQGGKGMDELRQETGARIDVPGSRDIKDPSGLAEIQIRGTKAQVAAAKKAIEAKKTVFDQSVTKTIEVDKKYHRTLIGGGGSNLRDIIVKAGGSDDRQELARTVQFPRAEADGNTIKIQGKKEVVDKIIAAMQAIVGQRENQITETVQVPTTKHRSLIGRGGETKKDLETKFNVSIDIPRQGSDSTDVKISGQPADVEKAATHITELTKEEEGETVQVPRNIHHAVSDNGQLFRKLRNDHKVTVDHANHKTPPKTAAPAARANGGALPLITDDQDSIADAHSWNVVSVVSLDEDGEIPWILRGPPANVEKAKSILAQAIEQAQQNTTTGYLVLPDPRTYRYVIGQGGSKVNSIRKQTGCRITVPKDQAADEAIEINGSDAGVDKAKDLILEAVREGIANSQNGRS